MVVSTPEITGNIEINTERPQLKFDEDVVLDLMKDYIGDTYRSKLIAQEVDQTYDFNNSDLIRNTLPYAVGDSGSDNDFINSFLASRRS